jgi:alanyl-tRNA synthetase
VTMIVQGKSNVYECDLFAPVMKYINEHAPEYAERSARIVADHLRSSLFMVGDGVFPSNKDQGYIVRRLVRRAAVQLRMMGIPDTSASEILNLFQSVYDDKYSEIKQQSVVDIITQEISKFQKTIDAGLKEFKKGLDPFILATTYGFPIELTEELAAEEGITIDRAGFDIQMIEHQAKSRAGAEHKFKGGLANTSDQTVKLHTAHHLLLAALQEVLGKEVKQKGSNITEERLRIDFNFNRKVLPDELIQIETLVNKWISEKHPVVRREMPKAEAEALGAEMEFGAKYPDIVSVYTIQKSDDTYVSKEFCGGPHVTNTGDIGHFKIQKEEA